MGRTLGWVKNILAEILNYLFFLAAGIVVLTDFAGSRTGRAGLVALGAVPVFYYIVRERCSRFPVFLLLHLLPAVSFGAVYQGNIFRKIWVLFVMAFLAVVSFGKKLRSEEMGMEVILPVVFGGFIWVLYLADKKQGGGACAGWLLYLVIGFMIGYFWHYFLGQFLHYIEVNDRTTENIPVGHVFRSAAGLAGGFTVLAGAVLVLGSDRELMDRIGAAIRQMIVNVIIFLLSLLPTQDGEEETGAAASYGSEAPMPWEDMGAAEPSILLKVIETILGAAVLMGLAVLLFFVAVKVIQYIRDVFAGKRAALGISGEGHEDLVEKLGRQGEKTGKKRGEPFWERAQKSMSPEERIRRIYKKAVEKRLAGPEGRQKGELTAARTPREYCIKLFPEQEQEALEFARLYEKARYGRGICSGDDVKKARKLAEGFHRKRREGI